jgi:hypothetical protein
MANETQIKDKTLQDHFKEYNVINDEHKTVLEDEEFLKLQIKEVDDTIEKLKTERKELEAGIADAANLLIARKATPDDILKKRQALFCIHGSIDDQEEIRNIYGEKMKEFPSIRRLLRERLETKVRELRHAKIQNLVKDIIKKNGDDLKQLIALVTQLENYSLKISDRENAYSNLGALLFSGLYGGGVRNGENPGFPSPNEIAANLQKFNQEVGIQ